MDKEQVKTTTSPLVDSGERTTYNTGAQRERIYGKGRCDLLPLDTLGQYLGDPFLLDIDNFIKTYDKNHLYHALEHFIDVAYKGDNWEAILEVAKHYEDGALKYAPNNWKKGLPLMSFIDSGIRHYFKWRKKMTDEPHDRAIVWNILGALWTLQNKPDCTKEEYN